MKKVNKVDSFYRPTRVEISLDALRHNIQSFQQILPKTMNIMAVVKANAYGHGAVEVSREALACGASSLAVAFLDEALELRRAGITAPILILGYTSPEGLLTAAENDITLAVYSDNVLEALAGLNNQKRLKIHIKLDTGMGRIGLYKEEEARTFIEKALHLPNVMVEGLFTHFAAADEADKSYTFEQYSRFERIVDYFAQKGIRFDLLHTGNSATAMELPELSYNMVRLGISMYGLYPSDEVNRERIDLQPVLSLKTGVVMVKTLPPGSGISYGTIYHTRKDERIATLPIGYADGFSRMLTEKAEALLHGRRFPVVGKICMDQCMIEVTDAAHCDFHDEVVLIGKQGDETITAEEIANWLGTINYEVTCMISHRVPRIYMRDGAAVKVVNPLNP